MFRLIKIFCWSPAGGFNQEFLVPFLVGKLRGLDVVFLDVGRHVVVVARAGLLSPECSVFARIIVTQMVMEMFVQMFVSFLLVPALTVRKHRSDQQLQLYKLPVFGRCWTNLAGV